MIFIEREDEVEKKKEVSKDLFLSYDDICVWHRYHEWIIVKKMEMQVFILCQEMFV